MKGTVWPGLCVLWVGPAMGVAPALPVPISDPRRCNWTRPAHMGRRTGGQGGGSSRCLAGGGLYLWRRWPWPPQWPQVADSYLGELERR